MQHLILSEWPFFSLLTPSKGQEHRPYGLLWNVDCVECEPELLILFLISKDFSFLVKCPWNADLDSLAKQCGFHMEVRCLGIIYINRKQKPPSLRSS